MNSNKINWEAIHPEIVRELYLESENKLEIHNENVNRDIENGEDWHTGFFVGQIEAYKQILSIMHYPIKEKDLEEIE